MLLQPETRPISQEQLVNEIKGIYAGLVMVEKNCVDLCGTQVPHKWIRSKREQEPRFDDFLSVALRRPIGWFTELVLNVYLVPTALEDTTRSLNEQRAVDLGIVAVEDIRILDKQRSVYLRRIWSLLHRLCDIDNRYERMFDPDPFMNERCFSADCWRHSSILVRYPWSLLALEYQRTLDLRDQSWIGTQRVATVGRPLPKRLNWQPVLGLAVYILHLEAYD